VDTRTENYLLKTRPPDPSRPPPRPLLRTPCPAPTHHHHSAHIERKHPLNIIISSEISRRKRIVNKMSVILPFPRRLTTPVLLLLVLFLHLPFFLHAQETGGNLSNCKGGCGSGESCIGNPFSQPVPDDECSGCAGGKYWWPCNFETLCYCGPAEEGSPRFPPAPKSELQMNDIDVCASVLTKEVFLKSTTSFGNGTTTPTSGGGLFTYEGLCDAIMQYNANHDEKFANAGDEMQVRAELAAFLAHAYVDTNGYARTREDMHCVDPITDDETGLVYCRPCKEENYDVSTGTCSGDYLASEDSYMEYCDSTRQSPQGCDCPADSGVLAATVQSSVTNYVSASDMYFARGAILNSWNYDYYGASQALTGDGNTLCENPDLLSTNSQMAWGAGIYKWMEKMKFGTTGSTAHKQVVRGNFGGTVEVLYGELECPASEWNNVDHMTMVRDRVSRICTTGSALGVWLDMDECEDTTTDCLTCEGLKDIFAACQLDGTCPDCSTWADHVIFVSDAPSVTPVRIQPPEDWGNWGGSASSSTAFIAGASSWFSLTLAILALFHLSLMM
jgi:hypothetical protein